MKKHINQYFNKFKSGGSDSNDKDCPFLYDKEYVVRERNIYLYNQIGSPTYYDSLCHELRTSTDRDIYNFYIASPGGDCHGGIAIANAMSQSASYVKCIVTSPSYSMGSLLALAGDELVMEKHTFLMFHNYSGATYGKGGELKGQLESTSKWLSEAFTDLCTPFLTKSEIRKLLKDQDVYISYDDKDIEEKITRHNESRGFREEGEFEIVVEDDK